MCSARQVWRVDRDGGVWTGTVACGQGWLCVDRDGGVCTGMVVCGQERCPWVGTMHWGNGVMCSDCWYMRVRA